MFVVFTLLLKVIEPLAQLVLKDIEPTPGFVLNVNNEEIKDKLLNKNKDLDPIDRIEEFKNWFFNNFTDQLLKKSSNNNNV